jgi:hypothetical protein
VLSWWESFDFQNCCVAQQRAHLVNGGVVQGLQTRVLGNALADKLGGHAKQGNIQHISLSGTDQPGLLLGKGLRNDIFSNGISVDAVVDFA